MNCKFCGNNLTDIYGHTDIRYCGYCRIYVFGNFQTYGIRGKVRDIPDSNRGINNGV